MLRLWCKDCKLQMGIWPVSKVNKWTFLWAASIIRGYCSLLRSVSKIFRLDKLLVSCVLPKHSTWRQDYSEEIAKSLLPSFPDLPGIWSRLGDKAWILQGSAHSHVSIPLCTFLCQNLISGVTESYRFKFDTLTHPVITRTFIFLFEQQTSSIRKLIQVF